MENVAGLQRCWVNFSSSRRRRFVPRPLSENCKKNTV